jgi:hypothetical protein
MTTKAIIRAALHAADALEAAAEAEVAHDKSSPLARAMYAAASRLRVPGLDAATIAQRAEAGEETTGDGDGVSPRERAASYAGSACYHARRAAEDDDVAFYAERAAEKAEAARCMRDEAIEAQSCTSSPSTPTAHVATAASVAPA